MLGGGGGREMILSYHVDFLNFAFRPEDLFAVLKYH